MSVEQATPFMSGYVTRRIQDTGLEKQPKINTNQLQPSFLFLTKTKERNYQAWIWSNWNFPTLLMGE